MSDLNGYRFPREEDPPLVAIILLPLAVIALFAIMSSFATAVSWALGWLIV